MEPKIIFEDSDLLVLDKPAGMIVNRADTTKDQMTVQDWVEEYLKITNSPLRQGFEGQANNQNNLDFRDSDLVFRSRAGIVHRLDKETSGILLVAKTLSAFINLQSQFKERKVQKTYLALAHGKIEPARGEINVEVGRLPWNRKRFGVLSGGRKSVTKYKALRNVILRQHAEGSRPACRQAGILRFAQSDNFTLVELSPKTGRTHQIRVHLQYIHHPIFADPLYAGRKTSRSDRKLLPRIFLHASKISFFHPVTNKTLSFESPLPKELADFLRLTTTLAVE